MNCYNNRMIVDALSQFFENLFTNCYKILILDILFLDGFQIPRMILSRSVQASECTLSVFMAAQSWRQSSATVASVFSFCFVWNISSLDSELVFKYLSNLIPRMFQDCATHWLLYSHNNLTFLLTPDPLPKMYNFLLFSRWQALRMH